MTSFEQLQWSLKRQPGSPRGVGPINEENTLSSSAYMSMTLENTQVSCTEFSPRSPGSVLMRRPSVPAVIAPSLTNSQGAGSLAGSFKWQEVQAVPAWMRPPAAQGGTAAAAARSPRGNTARSASPPQAPSGFPPLAPTASPPQRFRSGSPGSAAPTPQAPWAPMFVGGAGTPSAPPQRMRSNSPPLAPHQVPGVATMSPPGAPSAPVAAVCSPSPLKQHQGYGAPCGPAAAGSAGWRWPGTAQENLAPQCAGTIAAWRGA